MDEQKAPATRLAELPEETLDFLAQLQPGDIVLMREGIGLLRAVSTLGRFARWVAITVLGLVAGSVLFWESVTKILTWTKVIK
ncbi:MULTISPECIES: hypothetical protein [unclassified Chelatococcus]|uniref:hypothetical protein n=1 Tax=unclassified Chelatococcus TaxID=2638111 RepID=UPI001BCA9463|nr:MULTISPECIES: hypothetical protein [unclassified Chelatococcus]CAH1670854.1 conserved hypothetical protein [Hyphomicrobiales bacterium]MBS7738389.1 hypothetical protein [Chelatococcus sp. HY11]MBX3542793.1 hypothetical protein [Chelatococcus sp.]MCO5077081.1 hypothetical protein [Chelatococcus sp.]CAH1676924.1 conserved hypothetical protein [Hyphomicrobiales bacterium]